MRITFLGQGLESESKNSTGNQLLSLFNDKKYKTFTGISAFASQAGILGLSECIAMSSDHIEAINIIVGIDQEGTSREALEEINSLGVNSFVFYQKEAPIFHSKVYLFEGDNDTALIVGSSNLTARGLFCNVESSLMVEFLNTDVDGVKLLGEFKDYYGSLLDFTDQNLFKITSESIESFIAEGIVPKKIVWKTKHQKNTSDVERVEGNGIDIPKRTTVKIPSIFKGKFKSDKSVSSVIEELEIKEELEVDISENFCLWESGSLTERDLNIPKKAGTNPTGDINFTKGKLIGIDHRHYFRNVVFANLQWNNSTKKGKEYLENTVVQVQFIIQGIDYGIYSQIIKHNPLTDTTSYKQKNSMTAMSWGKARSLISHEELIGLSAFLYRNITNPDEYIFEIK